MMLINCKIVFCTFLNIPNTNLPCPYKVSQVNDDGLAEGDLGLGVVFKKMREAFDKRRSEEVGQLVPMDRSQPLRQSQHHYGLL